jgi:hypothetical protein
VSGVFQIGGVKALSKSRVDIAKGCPSLVTPIPTCENAQPKKITPPPPRERVITLKEM